MVPTCRSKPVLVALVNFDVGHYYGRLPLQHLRQTARRIVIGIVIGVVTNISLMRVIQLV